jgi:hypothetical protein
MRFRPLCLHVRRRKGSRDTACAARACVAGGGRGAAAHRALAAPHASVPRAAPPRPGQVAGGASEDKDEKLRFEARALFKALCGAARAPCAHAPPASCRRCGPFSSPGSSPGTPHMAPAREQSSAPSPVTTTNRPRVEQRCLPSRATLALRPRRPRSSPTIVWLAPALAQPPWPSPAPSPAPAQPSWTRSAASTSRPSP